MGGVLLCEEEWVLQLWREEMGCSAVVSYYCCVDWDCSGSVDVWRCGEARRCNEELWGSKPEAMEEGGLLFYGGGKQWLLLMWI